jgi:hypothetical protein
MKVTADGYISSGVLRIAERGELQAKIRHIKDTECEVIIDTDIKKKTRKQRGYYWSTLVPHTLIILRDVCGYSEYNTLEDAHTFLKYAFNPVYVPDPEKQDEALRLPGSTKGMKKEQSILFIDSIIMWAWDKFNYTMPAPKRKEDKYFISE